jgi:hypothetical protein
MPMPMPDRALVEKEAVKKVAAADAISVDITTVGVKNLY